MEHLLVKRRITVGKINGFCLLKRITIEFKSSYAIITDEDRTILLNRNGQKKLYQLLKQKFERRD